MRLALGPLLYVEWLDHAGHGAQWTEAKDIGTEPALVRTVGWLFHENKMALTLVPNHAEYPEGFEPHAQCSQTIVKSCIQRRRKLADPSRSKA